MTTTFCLQLLLGTGVSPSGFQVSQGFLMGKIRESVRAQLQTTGSTRALFRRQGFMMRDEVAHEIVRRAGGVDSVSVSRTVLPQHRSAFRVRPPPLRGAANPGNRPCCRLERLRVPMAAHSCGPGRILGNSRTGRVLGSLPSVPGVARGALGGQTRGLTQNVAAREAGDVVSA